MPRIRFFDRDAKPTTIDGDAVSLLIVEDTRLPEDENMGDEAFVRVCEDPDFWPLGLQH